MLNLAVLLEDSARAFADRDAVVLGDRRLTYAQVDAAANQVAGLLVERGIRPGDKVALSCPNLPYFPMVYYGIMKAGAAVVPLNVLFKPREVEYHLRDSDAKAVFVFEGVPDLPLAQTVKEAFENVESCTDLVVMTKDPAGASPFNEHKTLTAITFDRSAEFENYPTHPEDTCAILYTSGTTGQPKGAELTHFNLMMNVTTTWLTHLPVLDFTGGDQKTVLITLPLFHTTGQTVQMNTNLYGGSRIVLLPRFEPQAALETMVREKVNFWVGVPTMYWALLKYVDETGFDVSKVGEHMQVCTSGGAPMPVEVMKKFEEKFGVRVLEGYGLSETSPLATFNHFERPSKPGTVGQPIFGV